MTTTLTQELATTLTSYGWARRWTNNPNHFADEYGNTVALALNDETLIVTFGYALPGIVETLEIDPSHGATRIARVIDAMATPPTD